MNALNAVNAFKNRLDKLWEHHPMKHVRSQIDRVSVSIEYSPLAGTYYVAYYEFGTQSVLCPVNCWSGFVFNFSSVQVTGKASVQAFSAYESFCSSPPPSCPLLQKVDCVEHHSSQPSSPRVPPTGRRNHSVTDRCCERWGEAVNNQSINRLLAYCVVQFTKIEEKDEKGSIRDGHVHKT